MNTGQPIRTPRYILNAFAIFLMAIPARAGTETCGFVTPSTVVLNDGKQLLQFWEVNDSAKWTSGLLPDSPGYWRFVQHVRSRLDISEPQRYISVLELPTDPDKFNARLMLAGGIGDLKAINCLEALLFSIQAERRPMETQPTEFLAFILRRTMADEARLKIWFYTVDQPGIGRLGPLKDSVEMDVSTGWMPFLNLHNHNFIFDKIPVVPGVPWPSANDTQLMKNLTFKDIPFETTAVTNGVVTSHLRLEELKHFRATDAH